MWSTRNLYESMPKSCWYSNKKDLFSQDISLHHLIRSPDTTYGRLICEYDQMFRDPAKHDTISREIITDYLRMINSAKGEVLKRAEAILCTCTVAASPKMSKNCNVVQVRPALWLNARLRHLHC